MASSSRRRWPRLVCKDRDADSVTRRAASGARLLPLILVACLTACGAEKERTAAENAAVGRAGVYTPVTASACVIPSPEIARPYAARDLGIEECPAPSPYRFFVVSADARSWVDLRRDDRTWSTEERVVYGRDILALGHFPNVSGADLVEWRLDEKGEPAALIVRLRLVDSAGDAKEGATFSRLLVVTLSADQACDRGLAVSNDEARRLADTAPVSCATPLPLLVPR